MTEEEIQAAHVAPVQPLNGTIELVEYDEEWPRMFEVEAARVRATLGERVLLLEHVGSTSVSGLAAKPRIDMLLVVADSADEAAYVGDMEAVGYMLRIREPDWHEHRMFRGPDREINLHVFRRAVRKLSVCCCSVTGCAGMRRIVPCMSARRRSLRVGIGSMGKIMRTRKRRWLRRFWGGHGKGKEIGSKGVV